jgi:hypothetical protein
VALATSKAFEALVTEQGLRWRWTCSNACSRPRAKLPSLARTFSPL